jgi:Tfp pilus assembly protein PilX
LIVREDGVETFVMVLAVVLTIFGVGVAVGADIQDRMAEDYRRRVVRRHREMSAAIQQLRRGSPGGAV